MNITRNPFKIAFAAVGLTIAVIAGSVGSSVAMPTLVPTPPEGEVQFSQPSFTVTEETALAIVTLERVGGFDGELAVVLRSKDGTAKYGDDYYGADGLYLSWDDGDRKAKRITFPIRDNDSFEGIEYFVLEIRSPTALRWETPALAGSRVYIDDIADAADLATFPGLGGKATTGHFASFGA